MALPEPSATLLTLTAPVAVLAALILALARVPVKLPAPSGVKTVDPGATVPENACEIERFSGLAVDVAPWVSVEDPEPPKAAVAEIVSENVDGVMRDCTPPGMVTLLIVRLVIWFEASAYGRAWALPARTNDPIKAADPRKKYLLVIRVFLLG